MTLRLELFVTDPAASARFYVDVLAFLPVESAAHHATVRRNAVQLRLARAGRLTEHYFAPEVHTSRRGLGVEIVLEVPDVAAAHRRVLEQGYPLESPLQPRSWGLTDFRLADPDGYYLRVTSTHPPASTDRP